MLGVTLCFCTGSYTAVGIPQILAELRNVILSIKMCTEKSSQFLRDLADWITWATTTTTADA